MNTLTPEQFLQLVISKAGIAVFGVDGDGYIREAQGNQILEKLGKTALDLVGKKVVDVYGNVPGVRENLEKALNGESARVITNMGSVILESWAIPVKNALGGVEGAVAVSVDVTDRERVETDLRQQYKEMAKMTELMVGRELQMIELKRRIDELEKKCRRLEK